MHKILCFAAVVAACVAVDHRPANASEWGCEVLLCASSSAPSWPAIPACHPPMEKLILAMAGWNFSWPVCPEAGTGAPGYEKFEPCKAGYTAVHTGDDDHNPQAASEANTCEEIEDLCKSRPWMVQEGDNCNHVIDSYPRPVREEPYFFDITASDTGLTTRHYFGLNE